MNHCDFCGMDTVNATVNSRRYAPRLMPIDTCQRLVYVVDLKQLLRVEICSSCLHMLEDHQLKGFLLANLATLALQIHGYGKTRECACPPGYACEVCGTRDNRSYLTCSQKDDYHK